MGLCGGVEVYVYVCVSVCELLMLKVWERNCDFQKGLTEKKLSATGSESNTRKKGSTHNTEIRDGVCRRRLTHWHMRTSSGW